MYVNSNTFHTSNHKTELDSLKGGKAWLGFFFFCSAPGYIKMPPIKGPMNHEVIIAKVKNKVMLFYMDFLYVV